jgi:hypothetical protein
MSEFKSWEELTALEQAQQIYWDMYKDAYNVRPRGVDTSTWTIEDFNHEFEYLGKVIEAAEADRKEQEEIAVQRFEQLILNTIVNGAKSRKDALRWIMDASICNGDWEFLCYEHGLPYGFFRDEFTEDPREYAEMSADLDAVAYAI